MQPRDVPIRVGEFWPPRGSRKHAFPMWTAVADYVGRRGVGAGGIDARQVCAPLVRRWNWRGSFQSCVFLGQSSAMIATGAGRCVPCVQGLMRELHQLRRLCGELPYGLHPFWGEGDWW